MKSVEGFDWTLGLYGSYSKKTKDIIIKAQGHLCPEIWRAVSALFCVCSFSTYLHYILRKKFYLLTILMLKYIL